MSAGSGASNFGYSKIAPLSNINGGYVNVDNSNSPATFGSNQISGLPGLAGAKNNVDAAAGIVPGICLFKGGAKSFKRKIKNITKQYKKMKHGSRKIRSFKRKLRRSISRRSRRHRKRGGQASSLSPGIVRQHQFIEGSAPRETAARHTHGIRRGIQGQKKDHQQDYRIVGATHGAAAYKS